MADKTYDPYAEDVLVDDPYGDEILVDESPKREGMFTPFGVVVMIAAVFMVAIVAWGIYQNSLSQPEEGEAPDFTLPLIGEEGDWTLSEYQGQVVVINFWGSWCGPCRVEAPMLQRTYEDYQADGVIFVGIAVKDIESDAIEYIDEFGITYPNVMDIRKQAEDDYRTQGVPETFVVGKDGQIVKFFFAQPSERELRQAIEEALNA